MIVSGAGNGVTKPQQRGNQQQHEEHARLEVCGNYNALAG
jgi:hypothetical protein